MVVLFGSFTDSVHMAHRKLLIGSKFGIGLGSFCPRVFFMIYKVQLVWVRGIRGRPKKLIMALYSPIKDRLTQSFHFLVTL